MTNEMKLLRAWIECQGYEIEELDAKPCEKQPDLSYPHNKVLFDGGDYKVTKKHKSPFPWMDTNDPAWSAIVGYILDHQEDIEVGINDFGRLKPVLEFFSRNCKPLTNEDIINTFGESMLNG